MFDTVSLFLKSNYQKFELYHACNIKNLLSFFFPISILITKFRIVKYFTEFIPFRRVLYMNPFKYRTYIFNIGID